MSWDYRLPYGKDLRSSIAEGNAEQICDWLKLSIQWVAAKVDGIVSSDYEDLLEDLEIIDLDEDEDVAEQIDYILSGFYDLCDLYNVWIPI